MGEALQALSLVPTGDRPCIIRVAVLAQIILGACFDWGQHGKWRELVVVPPSQRGCPQLGTSCMGCLLSMVLKEKWCDSLLKASGDR